MQSEIRDLRAKLKVKEETIGFEKEQTQTVLQKVDHMNTTFKSEVQNVRKENLGLRTELLEKNKSIAILSRQVEDFIQNAKLEFPLMTKPLDTAVSPTLNLTNQKSTTKKFVSMKQDVKKKVTILDEIDQEFEDIMSKRPFGIEQDEDEERSVQSKVTNRAQAKTRGRSPNTTAGRK